MRYEDMLFLVNRCEARMNMYLSHLVRGRVEAEVKRERRRNLMLDEAELIIDYKQKWLAMQLFETQVSAFPYQCFWPVPVYLF